MSDHAARVFVTGTKRGLEATLESDPGLHPAVKKALQRYSAQLPDLEPGDDFAAAPEGARDFGGPSVELFPSPTAEMRDLSAELERVNRSLEQNLQSLESLDAPLARSLRKGLAMEKGSSSD